MATSEQSNWDYDIEPYLMTVLSKKFEFVCHQMSQAMLRSGRSGVLVVSKDFSSGITFAGGGLCMIDEGVPAHSAGMNLVIERTLEIHDEIKPGDCFLTNTPYAGNSHHADYTLQVPVFYDDELLFWTLCRAHQADVGAHKPSTYLTEAATIYEEGLHFPSIRIQEGYEHKEDIIRTCKLNIRVGETQWYGDYLAQLAAVRTGEETLQEMCDEYGVDTIKNFIRDWADYGERRMRQAIKNLPKGSMEYTAHFDPVPDPNSQLDLDENIAPNGIPINVKIDIKPPEGEIDVDITDNIDNIPAGLNLCEATTIASVITGIWNNLKTDIPRNAGSIRCVNIKMDEGKIVGIPDYPVGTSLATTLINDELINAMQAAFGQLGEPYGIAEGSAAVPANYGVISGKDHRADDDQSYIDQIYYTGGGGPALHGHDGWMAYGLPAGGAALYRSKVELDELAYPIMIHRNEIVLDSEGAGKWRGAPAFETEFGPVNEPDANEMTIAYFGNSQVFPPKGILGGEEGAPSYHWHVTRDDEKEKIPSRGYDALNPGEKIIGRFAGGGGYGDPLERDPEAVLKDVDRGIVSRKRARGTYGVILNKVEEHEFTINDEETRKQRQKLAEEQSESTR